MKRAASSISQTLRSSSSITSRPISSIRPTSIAGPSRTYATINSSTVTTTTTTRDGDVSAPIEEELLESPIIPTPTRTSSSSITRNQLPPNVVFEGFEEGEGIAPPKDQGGPIIHRHADPLGPVQMPLSSLASGAPTQAVPSGEMIELPAEIFAKPMRKDVLHRCVVWYLANLRQGSQSTKSRSTINYSGRKLRQQKGTGKARVGDAGSGIRRGGAPIFPLHPRDHTQLLPRKIRTLGLFTALSSKLATGLLRVVPSLTEAGWEGTNVARRALSNDITWTPVEGGQEEMKVIDRFGKPSELSILFIRAGYDDKFERIVRNIQGVEVLDIEDVQVWHLLKYRWCVMERDVVDILSGGEEDIGMEMADMGVLSEGEELAQSASELKI